MIRIEGIPTVTARLRRALKPRRVDAPKQMAPRSVKPADPSPAIDHSPRAAA